MTAKALLLLGALLSAFFSVAHAGGYTSAGTTFKSAGGSSYWGGAKGSVSGGTAQTIESVNIGGKYIGVPALGPIAAGATEMIVAGLRATPQALATAATIAWLTSKGIELIDGQWKARDPSIPVDDPNAPDDGQCGRSAVQCATSASASYATLSPYWSSMTGTTCVVKFPAYPNLTVSCAKQGAYQPCPTGYTESAGACFPNSYHPAGESDWDKVRGQVAPDAVLNDLCNKLASLYSSTSPGCKVSAVNIAAQTVPLSDWVTNPETGVQTRQVAKIQPAPTTDDPERVAIRTETETKTPAQPGTPENPSGTPEKTESKANENEDFCTLHPDSIVCSKLDIPEGPDLTKNDKNITIVADSGWGPSTGSCPADKVSTLRSGGELRISYEGACQIATNFRPVVLAFAWLGAILIAIGITKRYG